jgi:hypothetical protein
MPGGIRKDNFRRESAGTAAVIPQFLRRLFGVLASGFEELPGCSLLLLSVNIRFEESVCQSLSSAFDLREYVGFESRLY